MASTSARQRNNTDFRPRYPLDPFTNSPVFSSGSRIPLQAVNRPSIDLHAPWFVKADHVPTSQALRRDVILILGSSADRSIDTFLSSPTLAKSLIIIAAHEPPPLSSTSVPTIRILRLAAPLVVEDKGAIRLVSVLEWAERVARVWRAHDSNGLELLEFDEATMGNTPQLAKIARSTPGSPFGSSITLDKASTTGGYFGSKFKSKRLSVLSTRRFSSLSTGAPALSPGTLPPIDPCQRPFDAIINYISDSVAEKQILKQTILITSITRPFLASISSPYDKLSRSKSNRKSIARQPSIYSLPPNPPYQSGDLFTPASSSMSALSSISTSVISPPSSSAHTIHILPQSARPTLIKSLDSFLSSFSISNVGDDITHAKQYIMYSSTLCDMVSHPHEPELGEWSVADLVFNGTLDETRGKSWVGSGQDVLLMSDSSSSQSSTSLLAAAAAGPVRSPVGRSASDNLNFAVSRSSLKPTTMIPAGQAPMTIADLTPPPSPRTRTKSVPGKPTPDTTNSDSSSTRPKRTSSNPRPRSEVAQRTFLQTYNAQKPPSGGHPKRSSSTPLPPPKDIQISLSIPPPSSIPTLSKFTSSPTRTIRRSKLNNIVDVEVEPHSAARSFPTPPDSDDSGDSGLSSSRAVPVEKAARKSKWRFWKGR